MRSGTVRRGLGTEEVQGSDRVLADGFVVGMGGAVCVVWICRLPLNPAGSGLQSTLSVNEECCETYGWD
jgi:hypothetical protein